MSVGVYSASVRIGNWKEDLALEEVKFKDFLDKKDRGELAIQKSSKLQHLVNQKTELSVSVDGCLHFGQQVLLRNEGEPLQVYKVAGVEERETNTLVINMSDMDMLKAAKFAGTCTSGGSKNLEPIIRNTFVILPVEKGIKEGAPVRYGQHFCISTLSGVGGNLQLKSDIVTFKISSHLTRKQIVTFEKCASYLSHWRILHYDPQQRMENDGLPVPANHKVVINHCKSNQNLCVMSNAMFRTSFGREYEITAFTDLDSHKAENDTNHWWIQTGHPTEPTTSADILQDGTYQ